MAGASRLLLVAVARLHNEQLYSTVQHTAAPSHSALIWNGSTTSLVGLATDARPTPSKSSSANRALAVCFRLLRDRPYTHLIYIM
jgi:hypothetical protein